MLLQFFALELQPMLLQFLCYRSCSSSQCVLAACCHENQLTKRKMLFERKNAAKRNVATRQPARFVRQVLPSNYTFELER
jgi:hypothetical protein